MKLMILYLLILTAIASVSGFSPTNSNKRPIFGFRLGHASCNMITIAEGVEFDTIAREWRCKWSADGDKVSLVAAQKALEAVIDDVKKVPGVKKVDRVVCGGCLDFKVITSLSADDFGKWQEKNFAPESDFLEMLKAIDGISAIETQTYTIMPV